MELLDSSSGQVRLGKELGRGGEGSVFAIEGRPQYVAKVYHREADAEKAQKLEVMAAMAADDLHGFCAWPISILRKSPTTGVIGAILPYVSGSREIHNLYSPAHRKQYYSKADWRFLIRAARNCAIAFTKLHEKGVVIGDVNQGNILVDDQAIVRLIDCDSFQVRSGSRSFLCEVAVPHFVPPELQGRSLRGIERTQQHDCFGLALLVFHLLFMGRHPYAGRYSGKGEMPIEKAIEENRFAYGGNVHQTMMAPPPKTAPLSILPIELAQLFEQAFSRDAIRLGRPSAMQWTQALERLESRLKRCPFDPGHVFPVAVHSCPWCELVRAGAPNPFIVFQPIARGPARQPIDLSAIWRQIEAVPEPNSLLNELVTTVGAFQGATLPPGMQASGKHAELANALIFGGAGVTLIGAIFRPFLFVGVPVLVFALLWRWRMYATSPLGRLRRERRDRWKLAESALKAERTRLTELLRKYQEEFESVRRSLQSAKQRYTSAESSMQSELAALTHNARRNQLDDHLRQSYLVAGTVNGIGPSLMSTLESFGIETAYDISASALMGVPGFGEVRIKRLLEWRAEVESRFRFDPSKVISASVEQQIRARCQHTQQVCENEIRKGPHTLWGCTQQAQHAIREASHGLTQLARIAAQAKADYSVVGKF